MAEEGDSKLQAAAKGIAKAEWERLKTGPLPWHNLNPMTQTILESVAMKGLCVGLIMGNSIPHVEDKPQCL